MNTYIEISIKDINAVKSDLLIGLLEEMGFYGFAQESHSLQSYIDKKDFDEAELKTLSEQQNFSFEIKEIAEKNWNADWEANFPPIQVDDFLSIRADFHPRAENCKYEIKITPKMSFGTGHHATTYMMVQQMKDLDFQQKSVMDFGTGTGILAILAEKLGASYVFAIDNDKWSIENSQENLKKNEVHKIELLQKDTPKTEKTFDVILANINKNIILAFIETLYKSLQPNGVLILSGLLQTDESDILKITNGLHLQLEQKLERDNWISLRFKK